MKEMGNEKKKNPQTGQEKLKNRVKKIKESSGKGLASGENGEKGSKKNFEREEVARLWGGKPVKSTPKKKKKA